MTAEGGTGRGAPAVSLCRLQPSSFTATNAGAEKTHA